MNLRALLAVVFASTVLFGCPSKDSSQSSSGATSPSAGGTGSGPLANLEASPFGNEVWIAQEGGAQMPFIYYARENVRLSAQCRSATGQLNCEAIRQLRNAPPVDIQKRTLTGNVSAGTKVCMKLGNELVSAHNASGNEDGFCRFRDGSMISNGALEQYAMRAVD